MTPEIERLLEMDRSGTTLEESHEMADLLFDNGAKFARALKIAEAALECINVRAGGTADSLSAIQARNALAAIRKELE